MVGTNIDVHSVVDKGVVAMSADGTTSQQGTNNQQQNARSPAVHCLVCQCRLELHSSLFGPPEDGAATDCASSSTKSCAMRSDGAASCSTGTADAKPDFAAAYEHCIDLTSAVGTSQSANLLDLVADSTTPLEVPMCKKCANAVTVELNKQLGQLEKECIQYKKSLDHLLQRRADCPFDMEASRIKLDALKSEERDLLEQLALLEEEERTLTRELDAKQEERKNIGERDEELYRRLRDNHSVLIEQSDEQRSLKLQIKQANEQMRRLSRMNVLNLVFHIWVDGEYGTISGFRLGRLRHDQVEWSEINAALGQTAFLLKVIAERLNFDFVGYELVPCGSTSIIRIVPKNCITTSSTTTTTTAAPTNAGGTCEELPLYGGGGWRPFGQQALDKALAAFMDCFCQVEQRLKQYFPPGTQLLPYRMLKDKVVDKDSQYLVKMQLNSEERWTKAMKCVLLNMKRVIGILTTLPTVMSPTGVADGMNQKTMGTTTATGAAASVTAPSSPHSSSSNNNNNSSASAHSTAAAATATSSSSAAAAENGPSSSIGCQRVRKK